jgi:erythronate-4-phosphate dehydrogenase
MRIVVDSKNSFVQETFLQLGRVDVLPTEAITREALRDADAVIVRSETRVDARLLEGTRVRFVGTATIGVDHLDTAYLVDRGIAYANAPGSNAESVAQYVAASLLVLTSERKAGPAGMTIGVVGVGNVGSRVARVATGLGMRVLLNDPPLQRLTGDRRFVPLDSLMNAEIVSLHVPLTHLGADATYRCFDEERLAAMKRGSVLINTARGAVVETQALKRALRDGHLAAAVIDVWEQEPTVDVELLGLARIATPHIAGYSLDGKLNAARIIFETLRAHVGSDAPWKPPASLPPPAAAEIDTRECTAGGSALLDDVVRRCYDIRRDSDDLQRSLLMPHAERAHRFRTLRADYPVRREFGATAVLVSRKRRAHAASFASLGFMVREA